jgi:hypothetical protein
MFVQRSSCKIFSIRIKIKNYSFWQGPEEDRILHVPLFLEGLCSYGREKQFDGPSSLTHFPSDFQHCSRQKYKRSSALLHTASPARDEPKGQVQERKQMDSVLNKISRLFGSLFKWLILLKVSHLI